MVRPEWGGCIGSDPPASLRAAGDRISVSYGVLSTQKLPTSQNAHALGIPAQAVFKEIAGFDESCLHCRRKRTDRPAFYKPRPLL